jgi:serine/threonine-protein kinase RsbW
VRVPVDVNEENLQPSADLAAPSTSSDAQGPSDGGALRADTSHAQLTCRGFIFYGDLASIPESREQIMQFVSKHCPNEGDQIDILVAVQEALTNAALHGCGDDPAKQIQCTAAADASDIIITIRDPGPGFDPSLADPSSYATSTLTYGRGICLMRGLMTDVTFARGGTEIQLRKRIDGC